MGKQRWLVDITTSGTSGRVLYAIPHAGAGAAAVKKTCRALGDTFDTVAVRLAGRESRMDESPVTDLDVLADALAEQVSAHAGDRQVFLYGHCSGGVIAYEVARRLEPGRLGHLVVSAQEAPDRIRSRDVWRLPQKEFLAEVANDGYLPTGLLDQPEMVELVEPALRGDYQAVGSHHSSMEVIPTPVLALLGTEEHTVAEADVRAWEAVTSGGFRLQVIPGGHNLLLAEPEGVAEALRGIVADEEPVTG